MWTKWISASILLTWILLAHSMGYAQRLTEVTMGYFPGVLDSFALPLLAKAKGLFQKHGLDVQLVSVGGGNLSILALLNGNVRFSTAFTADNITALQREGKDPIMVYNLVNSATLDLVVRPEVLERLGLTQRTPFRRKMEALKGLTIGLTRSGGIDERFLTFLLRGVGLDPDREVNYVQIGFGPELIAAMKAGRIDVVMREPPLSVVLERQRIGVRLIKLIEGEGPPEFRKFAFKSVTVSKSWAARNSDTVTAYIRALREAYAWVVDNRVTSLKLLKIYFPGTDDEVLKTSFDLILPTITRGGLLSQDEIRNQVKVWLASGAMDTAPDISQGVLWTNRYNH